MEAARDDTRGGSLNSSLRGGLFLGIVVLSLPRPLPSQTTLGDGWRTVSPDRLAVTGRMTARALGEASGAVASVSNPGLYWTIADSGNPPELLATDTTGTLRARIAVTGAANVDWEAIGLGPCGSERCIYIADTGDNSERRSSVTIYRFPEPALGTDRSPTRVTAERLTVRYPDHPHDVEAAGVMPGGDLLLVTKGRSGAIVAFSVRGSAWTTGNATEAVLLDTLPIKPSLGSGRAVTGLAVNPGFSRVAIRTYREVFLFDRDTTTGRLSPHRWTRCDILGAEPQGEAIAWDGDGWVFLLLSERGLFAAGTVVRVDCGK